MEIENTKKTPHKNRFWKTLGPGLITGASDDDPSAITTFSQAGAQFGLATLWMAPFIYPVLAVIQEMCARIGLVTKMGLTAVIKKHYPQWVLYLLIIFSCPAFLLNIGADIAVIGSVGNLLFPSIPAEVCSILFTAMLLFFLVKLSYHKLQAVMKYICMSLLVYLIVPFLSHQNLLDIVKNTFTPHFIFSKDFLLTLTGILGAIVSPYLFFWQTSMEVEEQESRKHSHERGKNTFFLMRKDILYGALFAVIIMYFIILTAGTVLHNNHVLKINTVKDAARALEPLAGKLSYLLFSIGVISTGCIIIPVLSGSVAYIYCDTFKRRQGFNKKFREAKEFYIIIIISLLIGLLIQLCGIDPIRALLVTTAIYGITAPVLITIIMHICNNKKIMHIHTNDFTSNLFGYIGLSLMVLVVVLLLIFL